nr:FAD-binding protein [Streptomyces sp. NBC_00830]
MSDDRSYDVIIIGTGAGGGTLAHRLAPSGKRVLILERGGCGSATTSSNGSADARRRSPPDSPVGGVRPGPPARDQPPVAKPGKSVIPPSTYSVAPTT